LVCCVTLFFFFFFLTDPLSLALSLSVPAHIITGGAPSSICCCCSCCLCVCVTTSCVRKSAPSLHRLPHPFSQLPVLFIFSFLLPVVVYVSVIFSSPIQNSIQVFFNLYIYIYISFGTRCLVVLGACVCVCTRTIRTRITRKSVKLCKHHLHIKTATVRTNQAKRNSLRGKFEKNI
jgi:hypothetical protein